MKESKNIIYVNPLRVIYVLALFLTGILFYSELSMGVIAQTSPDFVRWLKTLGGLFVIHSLFMIFFDLQPDSYLNIRPYIRLILNGCYGVLLIGLLGSLEMIPILSFSKQGIVFITRSTATNIPLRIIIYIILGSIGISTVKSLKEIWGGGSINIQES